MPLWWVAPDLQAKTTTQMTRRRLASLLLPMGAGVLVGAFLFQRATEAGPLLSTVNGIIGGLFAMAMVGFLQTLALLKASAILRKRLQLPEGWHWGNEWTGYLFDRRPKYHAAVTSTCPFNAEPMLLPKVEQDITWPLEEHNDHGLSAMMERLYRNRRQDRLMHLNVYKDVMRIDATCLAYDYRHADAAAVITKLGVEQGLEAIRSRIPAELATALA